MAKKNLAQWDIFETALWGYSAVLSFLVLISSILPFSVGTSNGSDPTDLLISVGPICIFLIIMVIRYKDYKWNKLRLIFGIYTSILVFASVVGYIVAPSIGTATSMHYFGVDILGFLLFLPVFIFFILIGKDRLEK